MFDDPVFLAPLLNFEESIKNDFQMEFDLTLTNSTPSYIPDVILACNDDISANLLSSDQKTVRSMNKDDSA